MLWVPPDCAHGFYVLTPNAEFVYKCTDFYAPEAESAVHWASCGIDWALAGEPTLSEKDAAADPLSGLDSPFIWGAST